MRSDRARSIESGFLTVRWPPSRPYFGDTFGHFLAHWRLKWRFFVFFLVHFFEVRFFIDFGVDSGMADMRSDRAGSIKSHVRPFAIWTQKGYQKMSFGGHFGTQIRHLVPKKLPGASKKQSEKRHRKPR